MQVELVKENTDGSAVFTIDMTPEESRMLVLLGLKTAILAGIEEGKKWDGNPDLQESAGTENTGLSN